MDPTSASLQVAFCGLGHLGGPVCDVLLASPHRVAVFDPRPDAVAPRVAAGARGAANPADAAIDADVIVIFVRDDAQALDAVTGSHGVLRAAQPGSVVVLHSTVAPATVRTLDAASRAVGVGFVDAGVSTGGGRAKDRLYVMCGGDPAAIDRARPVMSVYAADIVRFGDVGAGMQAKLIRNAMRYGLYALQYEGMAFAEAAGLDLRSMEHLYRATFATAPDDDVVLARSTMVPVTPGDPLADSDFTTAMCAATTLGWKDLDDAYELAHEVRFEVAMAVRQNRCWVARSEWRSTRRNPGDRPTP